MTNEIMKACRVCNTELPLDVFPRNRKSKDGHTSVCKPCVKNRDKEQIPQRRERDIPAPDQRRVCSQCGHEGLLVEDYYKNERCEFGYFLRCKKCVLTANKKWVEKNPDYNRENMREWRAENPERNAEINRTSRDRNRKKGYLREWYLNRTYGLTREQYDAMAAEQGNRCFLCSSCAEDNPRGMLYVDHDHATGKVRKLLCMSCNTAIGHFRDDFALMVKASLYLQEIPIYSGFHVVVPQLTPTPERNQEICVFPEYVAARAAQG
jgi:hypothetical protein